MNNYTNYNFTNGIKFRSKKHYIDYSTQYRSSIYYNCDFIGFDIKILNGSIFINCKFYNMNIVNNVYDTKFENCTFKNIKIDGSHTTDSTIVIDADFKYCIVEKININRCYIRGTIQYSNFYNMIIQHCDICVDTILACNFYVSRSIVVMNSTINSKITNCDIFGQHSLYLYKCSFNRGIMHDNQNDCSNLMIYESNITDALRQICPKEGSFICYKKVYAGFCQPVIATLVVPADAKRISSFGRKCRAEYAKVIKLELLEENNKEINVAYSGYHEEFTYHKGKMVYPDSFDDNMLNECSHGIHFFIDKNEAINY